LAPNYGSYSSGYAPDVYGGAYRYDGPSLGYDSGYSGYAGGLPLSDGGATSGTPYSGTYGAYNPSVSVVTPSEKRAHITLSVPEGAQVWFEGGKTKSTGAVRQFQSPPLTPGEKYTYEIRARWTENGREVTQTQQVGVSAGANVRVAFPAPKAR
jgi:uncharacterized protein (TIGR03000 family)